MKTISILGSTGSIGTQAIDVAANHEMRISGLAAHSNIKLLEEQVRRFKPEYACIYDENLYAELKQNLSDVFVKISCGMDGLCTVARNKCDIMLNSVVGMVGLLPTLTAIEAGTDIALANKETLVAGGKIVTEAAENNDVQIFPVDSEHSAIFQCLQGNDIRQVSKVILTASGGPFFGKKPEDLQNVTLADALNHPNWKMGSKITVDSATLMNKGLEFIEAKWLFNLEPEQIEVVVHRQSVMHSAVEYKDWSVIAQMGVPDMKIPIQYALLYPERRKCPTTQLSLTDYGTLTFEKPDYETFKCLSAAIRAIELGGAYPCLVNSVNEEAVAMFLDGKIGFLQIGEIVSSVLEKFEYKEIKSYSDVVQADILARNYVKDCIER